MTKKIKDEIECKLLDVRLLIEENVTKELYVDKFFWSITEIMEWIRENE